MARLVLLNGLPGIGKGALPQTSASGPPQTYGRWAPSIDHAVERSRTRRTRLK